jgi:hypothetical protein
MATLEAGSFMMAISAQKMMREREKSKSAFRYLVSTENCNRKTYSCRHSMDDLGSGREK